MMNISEKSLRTGSFTSEDEGAGNTHESEEIHGVVSGCSILKCSDQHDGWSYGDLFFGILLRIISNKAKLRL